MINVEAANPSIGLPYIWQQVMGDSRIDIDGVGQCESPVSMTFHNIEDYLIVEPELYENPMNCLLSGLEVLKDIKESLYSHIEGTHRTYYGTVYVSKNNSNGLDVYMTTYCRASFKEFFSAYVVQAGMIAQFLKFQAGLPIDKVHLVCPKMYFHAHSMAGIIPFVVEGLAGREDDMLKVIKPIPLLKKSPLDFITDINMLLGGANTMGYKTRFISRVAVPLIQAQALVVQGECKKALEVIQSMENSRWKMLCEKWTENRLKK